VDVFLDTFLNWQIVQDAWPILWQGLQATLLLSALVVPLGILGGVIIAVLSTVRSPWVKWPLRAWVDTFRALPPLVLLIFIFAGLPFIGLDVGAWGAVAIGFFLNTGAYYGEILRAGIESIPRGQIEAARSTGLTRGQTMVNVVLPQAGFDLEHAGGGEAHLHRLRRRAAGVAVPGAPGAIRDLQRDADHGRGSGVFHPALAVGAGVEPAREPATGRAALIGRYCRGSRRQSATDPTPGSCP